MEGDLTQPQMANESPWSGPNSVNSLRATFMSDLPVEVSSAIDAQNPFDVDLSSTSTLSQGEKEYYKKQFATLKSFEGADWVVSSEGTSEEDNKEEAKQERTMKLSNYGNIVLLIFKIYATLSSGALAITTSTFDSVLDLVACFILWLTHISMGRINICKYPIGKLRVHPVGISIFASVMSLLGLRRLGTTDEGRNSRNPILSPPPKLLDHNSRATVMEISAPPPPPWKPPKVKYYYGGENGWL